MTTSVFDAYWPRRRGWQLAVCEAVLLAAALALAFLLRFGRDAFVVFRYADGFRLTLLAAACMLCLYGFDLYEAPVAGDLRQVGARLLQAGGAIALGLAVAHSYLPRAAGEPAAAGVAAGGLALWLFRAGYLFWNHNPRLSEPVLLVGEGRFAIELRRELRRHGELGLPVAGLVDANGGDALRALAQPSPARLARRLVAAFPGGWGAAPPQVRDGLRAAGYRLDDGIELYQRLTGKLPVEEIARCESGFRADARLSPAVLAAKRVCDACVAGLALLVTWPLLLGIALLVRLDSRGPALFHQRRIGRGGRPFTLHKFRSMRLDADVGGVARPAGERDPRCTRVGRWLRRLRLDELPQLWNIVRGDMSFVGPRPFVPEQELECAAALPLYRQRWSVPPGATGWAQVNRGYCATLEDNAEKLAYDLFYVAHVSLAFDWLILVQTLKVVCFGRGGR